MRIYRSPEMKWFDSGVRANMRTIDTIVDVDFAAQTANKKSFEVVNSVNTAWQMNEHDLLCEESAIMYMRASGLVISNSLANVKNKLEAAI